VQKDPSSPPARQWPIGAEILDHARASFRVWAPREERVSVLLGEEPELRRPLVQPMEREPGGYFATEVTGARAGMFYRYRLGAGDFPDPASRFQPLGPHGPSQLVEPGLFAWSDGGWTGVARDGQILYEMHVGAFTPEGTWTAARERVPRLAELGVTVLEIMPVADFPGRYGWGYDGVNLFAPTRLYGTPDDFRAFVDAAHGQGIGVILDVVYNHLGPDGNALKEFSPDYFTDRYENEWGEPLNFDGPESGPVREFFVTNAAFWIAEFHLDGLRLDATQQIFDASPRHILAEIADRARQAGDGRMIYLIAENEPQHARLLRPPEQGGFGLDAAWNDDFHHAAIVALTGKNEAYYTDYRGAPQEFISAAKYGYLYQGQRYTWQKHARGTPALDLDPARFVTFIQNHDQIANSLRGRRIHAICNPGSLRTMTALLLLGPGTPMLFQGQEFAASAPFLYFADHNPELARGVAEGRREFLKQFPSLSNVEAELPEPESEDTFRRCKLDFAEVAEHRDVWRLHRDLIALRRSDPVILGSGRSGVDGAVLGEEAFALRYFGRSGDDRLLLFNFGRLLRLDPMPEPLLAPPEGAEWRVAWCGEAIRYGGEGAPPLVLDGIWHIPARTAILMNPAFEEDHGNPTL
jgi:maltooligosyltrehalose trehalohydrolase